MTTNDTKAQTHLIMLTFRPPTISDAQGIARLLNQLDHPCPVDFLKGRIQRGATNNNEVALVADSNGKVVGFLVMLIYWPFHHLKPVGRLLDLCVMDSHRRKRIGDRLVSKAALLAKKKKCSKLEVSCQNFRKEAHKFYEHMGFEQTHLYLAKSIRGGNSSADGWF
jgi:ribosomal protein S18 acetylase RimI-like enzyme